MWDSADPRDALIAAASHFYAQGWMAGTAGNLSARDDDGHVWITASGRPKGRLGRGDFVRLRAPGTLDVTPEALSDVRPSAESAIHQVVYRLYPQARACFHVHSVDANLAGRLPGGPDLPLPTLEMLKGFGLPASALPVTLPLFDNHADVADIAAEVEARFAHAKPALPALLIRDHGVTVWADSVAAAFNYVELAEYVFRFMIAAHRAGLS